MKFKKILAVFLCTVMWSLVLSGCERKNGEISLDVHQEQKATGDYDNDEMSEIRTFIGTESNNDGYMIIKQDGYGKIHEWTCYNDNDEITANLEWEYGESVIPESQSVYDADGNLIRRIEYQINSDGKVKKQKLYVDDEPVATKYFVENADDIKDDDKEYVIVKYDELGRIVRWESTSGLGEVTKTKYNKYGLKSETTYRDGKEEYRLELKQYKEDSKNTTKNTAVEDHVIVMGTNAAYPPFEYAEADGFDGIDIALAHEIAAEADKELEISDMEFDELIASVASDNVDMIISGMIVTEERKEFVDFSIPYYTATHVILTNKNNTDITCAYDLKANKKVGVKYYDDWIVTDELCIDEANIKRVSNTSELIGGIKNGEFDAVITDLDMAELFAEKNGLKIIEDRDVFGEEEYAVAVRKDNKKLLEIINKTINNMQKNGRLDDILLKYCEADNQ